MLKIAAAALLAAAPVSAPVLAYAAPASPSWTAFADCAAAYRANAGIDDPSRAPSMRAMISDTSKDYVKAAVRAYAAQEKGGGRAAPQSVEAYVAKRTAGYAQQPRSTVEHVIDACPQPDA